jgi:hypothetical protein
MAGTPAGVRVRDRPSPVVSLRFTTGYKLGSLRDHCDLGLPYRAKNVKTPRLGLRPQPRSFDSIGALPRCDSATTNSILVADSHFLEPHVRFGSRISRNGVKDKSCTRPNPSAHP